MSIHRKNKN